MGNSSSNIINNINSTIATNILNSIQSAQKNSVMTQSIIAKCDAAFIKSMSDNYNQCIYGTINSFDSDDIIEICSPLLGLCNMTNISLSSTINILDDSINTTNVSQYLSQNLTNALQQYNIGSGANTLINNINNEVSNQVATIVQNLKNSLNSTQTIELNNSTAKFVSIKNTLSMITNTLQSDSNLQKSVSDIANTITQTNNNTNSSYLTVFYYIVGIILVAWFLIKLINLMSISSSYADFFKRVTPYIGFILLSGIVIYLHVLLKPSYITFIDGDGNKAINKQKFTLFMSIYVVIIGIVFYIVNGAMNK